VQALDHKDICASNRVEWARLVLAILELTLLVVREGSSQLRRYVAPKLRRGIERKEGKPLANFQPRRRIVRIPKLQFSAHRHFPGATLHL
jgi:hypothetical protein